MSKNRYVNSRFWSDTWVAEELEPIDRLVLLYLMTNDRTTICGIYEVPLKLIAMETDIPLVELKAVMKKLEPKVYYIKGHVVLANAIKHQNYKNSKIVAGIQREMCNVPPECIEKINPPSDFDMSFSCPVTPTSVNSVDKHDSSRDIDDPSHYTIPNLTILNSTEPPAKPAGLNKKSYRAAVRADEAQAARDEKAAGRKGSIEPVNVTVRRKLEEKGILKS